MWRMQQNTIILKLWNYSITLIWDKQQKNLNIQRNSCVANESAIIQCHNNGLKLQFDCLSASATGKNENAQLVKQAFICWVPLC